MIYKNFVNCRDVLVFIDCIDLAVFIDCRDLVVCIDCRIYNSQLIVATS